MSAFTFTLDPDRRMEDVNVPREGSSAARVIASSGAPWTHWRQAVIDCRDRYRREGYLTGHEIRMEALRTLRSDTSRVLEQSPRGRWRWAGGDVVRVLLGDLLLAALKEEDPLTWGRLAARNGFDW